MKSGTLTPKKPLYSIIILFCSSFVKGQNRKFSDLLSYFYPYDYILSYLLFPFFFFFKCLLFKLCSGQNTTQSHNYSCVTVRMSNNFVIHQAKSLLFLSRNEKLNHTVLFLELRFTAVLMLPQASCLFNLSRDYQSGRARKDWKYVFFSIFSFGLVQLEWGNGRVSQNLER